MYDKSDPRAALAPAAAVGGRPPATDFAGAEYAKFYETPPQLSDNSAKTWLSRGQNFIVAFSEVTSGAVFQRAQQVDEYVLLLPDADTRASVATDAETRTIDGYSITFLPPGASKIAIAGKGRVVRLFSSQSADLAAQCSNAASYAKPHPNIPPFVAWPAPKDGYKVRSYSLDVPDEPGRFGRIWRGTTMMVNFIPPQMGPRDPKKMSPHHHDDFEQCSLVLEGAYAHHLRWPWTIDMTKWRADDHEYCAAPSMTVIPPPSIHTSEAKAPGLNLLVDIFSPPRLDFSLKPGWVLNSADYPLPQGER
jgi:hypothetical protein